MTNVTRLSRDDFLDAAAERRAIAAYRRDGIEECLYETLSALDSQPEHYRHHCARRRRADGLRLSRGLGYPRLARAYWGRKSS
jgi:hypothetical protein